MKRTPSFLLAALVFALGCRAPDRGTGAPASTSQATSPPASSTAPAGLRELEVVSSGAVTAHFWGTPPEVDEGSPAPPLEYGVTSLSFTFRGDPQRYPFKPEGTLYFNDWRFDIFSPGGGYVLLLQDRFGPYHVVSTARLRDYLLGRAEPDDIVAHRPSPSPTGFVPVHEDARWISETEFEFVAGSETPQKIRHKIRAK